jgi:hypothetical protein
MRKTNFLLLLILLASIIFSCTHSERKNIKIYLPVSENYSNKFADLFLYTEDNSQFYYVFYVGDESCTDRHFIFSKGHISKENEKYIFIDFLGRELFTANESKNDLMVKSGLFKGFKLMNCDTADFIEPVNFLLNMSKEERMLYCVPDFDVISIIEDVKYYESTDLIHKEFEIFCDKESDIFNEHTMFILRKDGSFEITYDNLPIRKGNYINDSGYITFYDTVIPVVEKAVILKDSTLVFLTMPCMSILYYRNIDKKNPMVE